MKEILGYGKEGNQRGIGNVRLGESEESSFAKYLEYTSLEEDGKSLKGLSTTYFTNPQNFLAMYLS